jgi:hypothetical protein
MSSAGSSSPTAPERVTRLVGVYDADGSVVGELSYFVRARFGRAHCSLCDITHGAVRAKAAWTACRRELAVPFETYHRDDQPSEVRAATGGALPAVVAETSEGTFVRILGPEALDTCAGSIDAMLRAIARAASGSGLIIDVAAATST